MIGGLMIGGLMVRRLIGGLMIGGLVVRRLDDWGLDERRLDG